MPQTNSTVEERIVEMRFDNKQFESGVKQTMSTLDRLKEKLSFHNDVKGIDNIQNSINRMDFSVAMRGIDAFSQRLTALQIFGKRIVENLADDFYGAIKKVEQGIKSVFNQISTGGANRALNIEQAKFQLEGLHIAWEDIKGDIDYAVSGTAYGLDAAARVAAQLSASQVQVGDDMKAALRGISGVAAMTNSSYEEIGRIFSQVAGAGRLYTQDMLQMSSRGLNIAAALGQQLGHTEAEIREMVTKGQIDFKTFATAMNEAFGEQATKANNTYTGSLSNVKAALSRIGADIKAGHFETFRQVFVDLIPKLNEFKKAFKPVENVIIEVEAAVGKLLQKIIQMVDVSKIVSKIAKPVEKVGKKILEIVDVVTAALGELEPVVKTVENIGKSSFISGEKMKFMNSQAEKVKDALSGVGKESVKLSDELQAAKDIWNTGKYGNGQARIDALRAAGIDPDKTQAIIEEFIKNGYNWDEAVKKVSETTSEAVDENSEKAEKLKKKIQTVATVFRNIKRTVKAVATSVTNVISALIKSVTGSMEKFGLGDVLIKITGKIADLAEKFMITEEMAEKLTKPISLIQTIFKGIIGIGKKVVSFIFGLVTGLGKLAYSIGETIAGSEAIQSFIESFTEGIKTIRDGIKSFIDTSKKSSGLKKFVDVLKSIGSTLLGVAGSAILKIVDILGWAISHLDSFFSTLADIFGMIFGGIFTAGTKIGDFFSSMFDSIGEGTFIEDFKAKFDFLFSDENEAEAGQTIFQKAIGYVKAVFDWVVNLFNQHTLDEYLVVIKELMSITLILESMLLIGKIEKLFKNGISLIGTVDKVLKSTAKVNKSIANLNNAKAIAQIAKVILAFAAAVSLIMFTVVKTADYISKSAENAAAFDKVVEQVKHIMGIVLGSILAIIAALKLTDLAITMFTSKTKLHVPLLLQFGAFMFAIGYAIKQVLQAMIELADMDGSKLKTGGTRLAKIGAAIAGFFITISAIMALINKLVGNGADQATKGLYAMSLVLIAMALSVDILMAAVSWMSMMILGYGTETVEKAVGMIKSIIRTIMVMLSILIGAVGILGYLGSSQDTAKMFATLSVLFLAIGISLIGIMLAINDLTLSLKLFPSETKVAFAFAISTIISVMLGAILLVSTAAKLNANGVKGLNAVKIIIFGLVGVILAIGHVAKGIDTDRKLGALGVMVIGLVGILSATAALVQKMGGRNLKWQNILAIGGIFVSLIGVLVSLKALTDVPYQNIAMALTTLSFVIFMMQYVVRAASRLGTDAYKNILSLSLVFGSLALLILPLSKLKGEDWAGYLAAMGGLAAVVYAFSWVLKAIEATTTWQQILAIGGSIAIISAAFAGLAAVLGWMTTFVDPVKLLKITAIMLGLVVALGAMVAVISRFPGILGTVAGFALSMVLVAAAVLGVTLAINGLIALFPDFLKNLQDFAYTIGTLPGFIIAGLRDGLIKAFPNIYTLIEKLIDKFVIGAAEDELETHSPSKVFERLGNYVGEGFGIGIKDSFSNLDLSSITDVTNQISDALPDGFDLGSVFGGDMLSGISDGFNLDSLDLGSITGFDTSSLLGDTDITDLGNTLGMDLSGGINNGLKEGLMSIDPSTVTYKVEDLLADPSIYDTLKAAGIQGVTDAYEEIKRHEEFLAKNPTLESYKGNLEDYYTTESANLIRLMLESGDEAMRESAEKTLAKDYVDKSKVDNIVLQYSRAFQESMDKFNLTNFISNRLYDYNGDEQKNLADVVKAMQIDVKNNQANMVVKTTVQDENGNNLSNVFGSGTTGINLDYDNSTVKTNMDAVSSNISSVVNAQGDKIVQKLEYINNRVNTFDNNQSSRINNLLSRMNEMEAAINNMKLVLDTGAMVGQLVGPMDSALGEQARRKARG